MSSRRRRRLRPRLAADGYEASRIATVRAAPLVEGSDGLTDDFVMEESVFSLPELADVTDRGVQSIVIVKQPASLPN
jgi:hypothetical protein